MVILSKKRWAVIRKKIEWLECETGSLNEELQDLKLELQGFGKSIETLKGETMKISTEKNIYDLYQEAMYGEGVK